TNVLKVMLEHLIDDETEMIGLFDSIDRGLSHYAKESDVSYLETKEDIEQWIETAEDIFKTREAMYVEAVRQGDAQNLRFSQVVLMI
ncbi:hypothetical protein GUF45_27735, partial [Xanthomonas citri pv. citri]|nr:hypothetical protein [Xanthomonas citri pv. citri]